VFIQSYTSSADDAHQYSRLCSTRALDSWKKTTNISILEDSTYLLIEFDVSEYRMDPPCFTEHRPKCQGKAGHEEPRPGRADVRKSINRSQLRVQPKEDNTSVRQHTPYDNQVVQVWGRHLDIPEKSFVN